MNPHTGRSTWPPRPRQEISHMLRAGEKRRERYLDRRGSSPNDTKARFADDLLRLLRGLARCAVPVAAQIAWVLVERDRRGGDEAFRGAAPPHWLKGGFRRHVHSPNDKGRQRPSPESQISSLVGALLLPLRDEAKQQFAVAPRKLAREHQRDAHDRTIGVLVSDEWQRDERNMLLFGRAARGVPRKRRRKVPIAVGFDQRTTQRAREIGRT